MSQQIAKCTHDTEKEQSIGYICWTKMSEYLSKIGKQQERCQNCGKYYWPEHLIKRYFK